MAKSALQVRRVTSAEDRNAGRGQFISLKKVGDQFVGYALFKPDPELDDNPGYYEFFQHYTPATGYMPCAGPDTCPLCAEGDNPNTTAKTAWLIDDELKIFNMNWSVIQEFVDLAGDDETILGRSFRIKRAEGNGKYMIRPKTEKLNAKELKAALKDLDDDMLEKQALKQLRKGMEELDVEEAMNEDTDKDGDDDEDEKPKARKGSAKSSKAKEEETEPEAEFDPDEETEIEDTVVTVIKITKSKNIAKVEYGGAEFDLYGTDDVDLTEYSKGDEITVTAEKDEDGDFVVSEAAEAEAEPAADASKDGDVPDSFEGEVEVVSVNSDEDTLTVKTDEDVVFDLYFLDSGEDDNEKDWADLDLDDFDGVDKVTIVAAKDDDGDMLASAFPEPVKKSGGKKGSKKKK